MWVKLVNTNPMTTVYDTYNLYITCNWGLLPPTYNWGGHHIVEIITRVFNGLYLPMDPNKKTNTYVFLLEIPRVVEYHHQIQDGMAGMALSICITLW